jgi:Bacterial Ig domain/Calx-beta domain
MNWGFRTPSSVPTAPASDALRVGRTARPRRLRIGIVVASALFCLFSAPAFGANTFSIADVTVTEGDFPTMDFTVQLARGLDLGDDDPASVDYATTAGVTNPATAGSDYTAVGPVTVNFPASTLGAIDVQTISIPLGPDDNVFERDETFIVQLAAPVNGVLGAAPADAATGTILNDDATPTVKITGRSVPESNTSPIVFTVTRTGASEVPVDATLQTINGAGSGGATAGSDYVALNGVPVVVPDGPTGTAVNVQVPIIDDAPNNVFEGNETFTGELTIIDGATFIAPADATGTATITDTADTPTLAITGQTVTEAGGTQTAFIVTRTGASNLPATATLNTNDGPAIGGATAGTDYTDQVNALVTVNPSPTTTEAILVPILDDAPTNVFEGNETFTATITTPGNATIPPAGATATATITDTADTPTLAITGQTVTEAGGTQTAFIVTRTGASNLPATATLNTNDGPAIGGATAGTDYTDQVNALVTVNPSPTTTEAILVPILDDAPTNVFEGNETFTATITTPGNATIATPTATATITDTADTPTITIAAASAAEGTSLTFTVTRTGDTALPASATFNVNDGTATIANADYSDTSGTVTVTPGGPTGTSTVTVVTAPDSIFEEDETVTVVLSAPGNAVFGGVGPPATVEAAGTITNNDSAPILSITGVSVPENGGPALFEVTRTGLTQLDATATVNLNDGIGVGGAIAGSDYTDITNAPVTVPASLEATKTANISVTLTNETTFELAETFTARLTSPANATFPGVVPPAFIDATGTITNDDPIPVFSINDVTVTEGAASATTQAILTVSVPNASYQPITASWSTADGTATAAVTATTNADYVPVTASTLTIPAGSLSTTLSVTVNGDLLDEADLDTAFVNLTNALPVGGSTLVGGDALGQLNIQDDDLEPNVNFVPASTETQIEGNSGVVTKNLVLQLDAPSGRNVTVNWQTGDIPLTDPFATAGVDYIEVPQTALVFTPGQISKNLLIGVIGDTNTSEGSESVGLLLNSAINATLPAVPTKQLLILEDDVPNTAPFANNDTLTVNRNGSGTVNVRSNDLDANNDATFVPANGSASHGLASCQSTGVCAYIPTPGYSGTDAFTYTLSDGQATSTGTVNVTVVNATPIANADELVTGQGAPGLTNVLANDSDPDGNVLTIVGSTGGAHGTVACGAATCNYNPVPSFVGTDQFTYTIRDADGATAVGTVNVTVSVGTPLTLSAKATRARSKVGATNGYTLTVKNPNNAIVKLTSLSVCIPKGFKYVAGSATGPLAKVPAKGTCVGGTKLTWAKSTSIAAKGSVKLGFKVKVAGKPTTAKITATGKAADGFAVAPLTASAPIKVAK